MQVTRTPPPFPGIGGGGGTGYLFFHNWPPVKREPAITGDMVNKTIFISTQNLISPKRHGDPKVLILA